MTSKSKAHAEKPCENERTAVFERLSRALDQGLLRYRNGGGWEYAGWSLGVGHLPLVDSRGNTAEIVALIMADSRLAPEVHQQMAPAVVEPSIAKAKKYRADRIVMTDILWDELFNCVPQVGTVVIGTSLKSLLGETTFPSGGKGYKLQLTHGTQWAPDIWNFRAAIAGENVHPLDWLTDLQVEKLACTFLEHLVDVLFPQRNVLVPALSDLKIRQWVGEKIRQWPRPYKDAVQNFFNDPKKYETVVNYDATQAPEGARPFVTRPKAHEAEQLTEMLKKK